MIIKPISLDIAPRLENRRFRERFLATLARDEIAAQIRQLRLRRGFKTQTDFAKEVGMQQSAVSRIEQSDYSGWTFRTLLKVAFALKARLRITLEPIEDVIEMAKRSEQAAALNVTSESDAQGIDGESFSDHETTSAAELFEEVQPPPGLFAGAVISDEQRANV
jgi:transcriptional regulator with XRE-family HTH domain